MSNPFDLDSATPSSGPRATGPSGDFALDVAFSDGLEAAKRNAFPWMGAHLAGVLAVGVSFAMCVLPVIAVAPVVMFGIFKLSLQAVDGDAEFSTMFSGFNDFQGTWLSFGALLLMFMGIGMGMLILTSPLQFSDLILVELGVINNMEDAALATIPIKLIGSLLSNLVTVRFMLAPFMMVDRGDGAYEAMVNSWNLTGPVWLRLFGANIALSLINLLGFLACGVGVLFTVLVMYGGQASIYRQLTGTRRA